MDTTYRILQIFLLGIALNACKSPSIIATQSVQKGDLYANNNDFENAKSNYELYLTNSKALGIHRNYLREAEVTRKLSYIHSVQGDYDSSFIYLEKAYSIDTAQSDNKRNVLIDLNQLAIIRAYQGKYKDSKRFLNEAKSKIKSSGSNQPMIKISADLLFTAARISFVQGDYNAAKANLLTCTNIYQKLDNSESELSESCLLLSTIEKDLGDFKKSRNWVSQSIEISIRSDLNTSKQQHLLGDIMMLNSELEEGIGKHNLGLNEAKKSNIIPLIIFSYLKLGDAYDFIGDEQKAEENYKKAVELQGNENGLGFQGSIEIRLGDAAEAYEYYTNSGLTMGSAEAALRLAADNLHKSKWDSANYWYQLALTSYDQLNVTHGVTKARLGLIAVYLRTNELALAREELNRLSRNTQIINRSWQYWHSKGVIEHLSSQNKKAISSFKRSIQIIETTRNSITFQELKSNYSGSKNIVYEDLINTLLDHSNEKTVINEAFLWNEKARSRSFLDMLASKAIKPKHKDDQDILNMERGYRLKVSKLSTEINSSSIVLDELYTALANAISSYDSIKYLINTNYSEYNQLIDSKPFDITEIQHSLNDNELIVEYWIGTEKSYVWLVNRNEVAFKTIEIADRELNKTISGFRNSIKFKREKDIKLNGRILYEKLIEPLEQELLRYENIIIIPHRSLNFIPFQALLDSKGDYLGSNIMISYSPSSSIFKYCRDSKYNGDKSLISFALGDHKIGDFSPLPGSEREANIITKKYDNSVVRVGRLSTESYFKTHVRGYKNVHLATHGVLNHRNPMTSFLLFDLDSLNDGKLTSSEVFDLNLNADLVVLSACETGLGRINRGNDLVGLSRAFIYSGANAVIVSLWKVDDEATMKLMVKFYDNLILGQSTIKALFNAQQYLRDYYEDKKNSYYWAPFIIIGDGNS